MVYIYNLTILRLLSTMNFMKASLRNVPRHTVRLVAQRTGLTPHVLRAWERRYAVVHPHRSAGGHRLYSDLDLERLGLLQGLAAGGHSIGQLAKLPLEELVRLADEQRMSRGPTAAPVLPGAADAYRADVLQAVTDLDTPRLQSLLDQSLLSLGVPAFVDGLAAPVLQEIGERWSRGQLSVAHEHLATAAVRRVLGWALRTFEVSTVAPGIVVATPPRQVHELGALLVAVTAAAEGWGVSYLGADLPVADILSAARQTRARVVALSVLHPTNDPSLLHDVAGLRQALAPDVVLVVGGGAINVYGDQLAAAGARIIPDLAGLRTLLASLHSSGPAGTR